MSIDFPNEMLGGSDSIWAPFTEDTIAKHLNAYGERISQIVTDGCEDCEITERCCAECYDDRMQDKVKSLVKKMKSYRKRMNEANNDPVTALMNQIKKGGE